jgi:UDP:flavonoid glycosyltransferase YjiC (YdhE family)
MEGDLNPALRRNLTRYGMVFGRECPRRSLDPARSTLWGAVVRRLKVGTSRRFSSTTESALTADLRRILAPLYPVRAGEIATRMTKPSDSIAAAADRLEDFASKMSKKVSR